MLPVFTNLIDGDIQLKGHASAVNKRGWRIVRASRLKCEREKFMKNFAREIAPNFVTKFFRASTQIPRPPFLAMSGKMVDKATLRC
jgi:hypothetical protein